VSVGTVVTDASVEFEVVREVGTTEDAPVGFGAAVGECLAIDSPVELIKRA
jgi:hypothetical protein